MTSNNEKVAPTREQRDGVIETLGDILMNDHEKQMSKKENGLELDYDDLTPEQQAEVDKAEREEMLQLLRGYHNVLFLYKDASKDFIFQVTAIDRSNPESTERVVGMGHIDHEVGLGCFLNREGEGESWFDVRNEEESEELIEDILLAWEPYYQGYCTHWQEVLDDKAEDANDGATGPNVRNENFPNGTNPTEEY